MAKHNTTAEQLGPADITFKHDKATHLDYILDRLIASRQAQWDTYNSQENGNSDPLI